MPRFAVGRGASGVVYLMMHHGTLLHAFTRRSWVLTATPCLQMAAKLSTSACGRLPDKSHDSELNRFQKLVSLARVYI